MAFAVTNAGITNFNPLIISGYGFSRTKTVLMASPQAAVAIVAQVTATVIMLYVPNVRCIIWVLSTLPAIAGTVMIHCESFIFKLQIIEANSFLQCWISRRNVLRPLLAFTLWASTTSPLLQCSVFSLPTILAPQRNHSRLCLLPFGTVSDNYSLGETCELSANDAGSRWKHLRTSVLQD